MPNDIVEEVPVEPVAASTGWAVGACVAAVGFGAALAYLFDPHRGKYRRAILRNSNKSAHLVREAAAQMEGGRGVATEIG